MKFIITTLTALLLSFNSSAWSLKTHLWIAQQVLNDVLPDGKLSILDKEYAIPAHIYKALKECPQMFRMGSLGPDVFPDPVAGQMTTHPGVEHGWQTDQWLHHLLKNAKTSEEIAFAYGFVVHACSDMFAHTYVNAYAGDIFILSDSERVVETRHFALEKFIEKHTPEIKDINGRLIDPAKDLGTPYAFIAKNLVMNELVYKQYESMAPQLWAMYKVKQSVIKLGETVDNLAALILKKLGIVSDKKKAKVEERNEISLGVALLDRQKNLLIIAAIDEKEAAAQAKKIEKAQADYEKAQKKLDLINIEIAQLDAEASAIAEMSEKNNAITRFIKKWSDNIDTAAYRYVQTSHWAGIKMLTGEGNPVEDYKKWASCYGFVFMGVPLAGVQAYCEFRENLRRLKEMYDDWKNSLPVWMQWLIDPVGKARDYVYKEFEFELYAAGKKVMAMADPAAAEFMFLLLKPKYLDSRELDSVYREDISTKNLLIFNSPTVSTFIMDDMHTKDGHFDPAKFGPAFNSVILAKLALLDPAGLNSLVKDNVGAYTSPLFGNTVYSSREPNFTLLLDVVKSIDGNHQWQPYPLPYPRNNRTDSVIKSRSYGYNFYEDKNKGLKLWIDPYFRKNIFYKLFPFPAMGALSAKEELKQFYNFPECPKDPFPCTIDEHGNILQVSKVCKD